MQNCTRCTGKRWYVKIDERTGLQKVDKYGRRWWRCWRCDPEHLQLENSPSLLPKIYRTQANILYIDLEVSKSLIYNYGLRVPSKFIHPDNLVKEYFIICWSVSYVGSDKIWSDCVTTKEAVAGEDKNILQRLRDLMNGSDLVAGHNVASYDLKRANTRFLLNGIEPVSSEDGSEKKTMDTLKIARSKFSFESNTLDYISQRLGFRPKDNITNDDWLKIVKTGDRETLKKVNVYCQGDVINGKNVLQSLMKYSGKKEYFGSTTLQTIERNKP